MKPTRTLLLGAVAIFCFIDLVSTAELEESIATQESLPAVLDLTLEDPSVENEVIDLVAGTSACSSPSLASVSSNEAAAMAARNIPAPISAPKKKAPQPQKKKRLASETNISQEMILSDVQPHKKAAFPSDTQRKKQKRQVTFAPEIASPPPALKKGSYGYRGCISDAAEWILTATPQMLQDLDRHKNADQRVLDIFQRRLQRAKGQEYKDLLALKNQFEYDTYLRAQTIATENSKLSREAAIENERNEKARQDLIFEMSMVSAKVNFANRQSMRMNNKA